jgi:aminoglycoside/choline kinase family phosphotransferase
LRPASADASFRRYLRIDGAGRSFIVMDAPPAQEDCRRS